MSCYTVKNEPEGFSKLYSSFHKRTNEFFVPLYQKKNMCLFLEMIINHTLLLVCVKLDMWCKTCFKTGAPFKSEAQEYSKLKLVQFVS